MKKNYRKLFQAFNECDTRAYLTVSWLRKYHYSELKRIIIKEPNFFADFLQPIGGMRKIAREHDYDCEILNIWGAAYDYKLERFKRNIKFTHRFTESEMSSGFAAIREPKCFIITDYAFIIFISSESFNANCERVGRTSFEATIPLDQVHFISPRSEDEVKKVIEPDLLFFKLKHGLDI